MAYDTIVITFEVVSIKIVLIPTKNDINILKVWSILQTTTRSIKGSRGILRVLEYVRAPYIVCPVKIIVPRKNQGIYLDRGISHDHIPHSYYYNLPRGFCPSIVRPILHIKSVVNFTNHNSQHKWFTRHGVLEYVRATYILCPGRNQNKYFQGGKGGRGPPIFDKDVSKRGRGI